MNDDFRIGIHRRVFNKNLKDAIAASGKTYAQLFTETGIKRMSNIVNFRLNPNEDARVKIAIALNTPIDTLFPERYDELYNRISPLKRDTEAKVDFLKLTAPEVLMLEAPETTVKEAAMHRTADLFNEALKTLSPKERQVIELRLQGMRAADIAKVMGLRANRVRQIEAKAHERLRSGEYSRKLYAASLDLYE